MSAVVRERRAMLEVRSGPSAFRRVVLAPGTRVRVGRAAPSDLVLAGDEALAPAHFELGWTGDHGELRHLAKNAKTELAGVAVATADVGPDAWLRAGTTDFSLFFEDASDVAVPPFAAEPAAALAPIAEAGRLFAVVDAARSDRLLPLLRHHADAYASLYDGLEALTACDVAPYLVHVAKGSRLLPSLLAEWGDSLGVFFDYPGAFAELRAHLRKFVVVTLATDNAPAFFRFYDPRVLRRFLSLATVRQESLFFGRTTAIHLEGPDRELLRIVRRPG